MQRIHYAGHDFFTGNELADAVVEYACLLAEAGRYATIDVPTTAGDGGSTSARLLLGPSMPVATESVQGPSVELVDEAALSGLRDAAQRLRTPTAVRLNVSRRPLTMVDEYDVRL
ncbi:hypothetical protein [Agromyces ramosus]|uniref:Uncharacterized protein n=1 Tax=Agromyces ramosus TaxID=33879 RepID=A0ABU0RAA0_9MICO|nr:hypothetical protein [Agromyces ramosus]MDQ0894667.1 hypothetical protein [Agromyces ramosus]